MKITRIGATDKIIAREIVEGNATKASFTQLCMIPEAAAIPPMHAMPNKRRDVIPNRLNSASFKNLAIDFLFIFDFPLIKAFFPKLLLIAVSMICVFYC